MNINGLIGSIVAKRMAQKISSSIIKEEDVKELLREIRITLLDSDVNFTVVKNFINNIKNKIVGSEIGHNEKPSDVVLRVIKEELISLFGNEKELNLNKKQTRIMLVGLQGSGKTTTAGKLAYFLKNKHSKSPLLVACDVYRPAAIDQLKTLSEQVGVDFYQNGLNNPIDIVSESLSFADKQNNNFIIVDTAGRLQTNEQLMDELVNIKKTFHPDEIFLVVDAMAGQDIVNVATEFNNYLKLTGLIITKLDSDARAGATLSLTSILNVPIVFTGVGEKLNSLDVFHPDRMANRILGLGDIMTLAEKAADVYDEKQSKNAMQRMLSGKMDLEDLMKQMQQINKLGSISSILKMMPTKLNNKISENKINEMEEKMKIWKILLSSMTLKERRNPKLLKKQPNRKLRIIKGSGRKMDELNKLLKQWEVSRDKMAEAGKMLQSGKNPFGKNGFNMF